MRIVHLANFYTATSGGLRTMAQALGRGYLAAGHQFVLVVPGTEDCFTTQDFGQLITVRSPRLPASGGYRVIVGTRQVGRILDHLAPDRLEVSDRFTLRPLAGWARSRGVSSTFFAHERIDGLLAVRGFPMRTARALADRHNRTTAAAFDTIVATTDFAADEFVRIGAPRVEVVPLGVHPPTPCTAGARPNEQVELLLCSRLSKEKRPEIAIEAVRELHRRGIPVRLTVAGDGPLRRRLISRAGDLPVRFLGHVADRHRLQHLQAAADLALAPGPVETFGLAALESLAAGTAVVVSLGSALPEVIGPDPAAGRAAPVHPVGFADAVEELLRIDPGLRSAAAVSRAAEFPWTATVARMLALHQSGWRIARTS